MALSKRTYVDGTTKITAANLNEIQDSIIALEGKGITKEEVVNALEYTPAKSSDIPTSLKNPNALKFTGGATGTYDGSSEVTINIPTGGGSSVTVDSALSTTSENPVQNKVIKSALDGKLSLSGGTLTGNLTGKYLTGTWLQSTNAGHQKGAATKVAVLDEQGWIYYRTPAELMADMGLADGTEVSY